MGKMIPGKQTQGRTRPRRGLPAILPLQRARVKISKNVLFAPHNSPLSGPPELIHFSRRIDMVVWPPVAVEAR